MSQATQALKAADGKPAPQYWNTTTGDYAYWSGDNNGPSVQDAQVLAKLAEILAKQSADPSTATKQDAAKAVLDTIAGKEFATQSTLAQVLA
jgi:hypothetical protein